MMKLLYISIVACGLVLMGCKKNDSSNPLAGKIFVVKATSETQWVYFSFDKNDTVQINDPKNSTNWDLAFRRFNIKTNSGLSGKGIGGVYNTGKTGSENFVQLNAIPDLAVFTIDDSIFVPGAYGKIDTVIANPVLSSWYNYDHTTNILSSKNIVYFVKTALGRYAKLQIINYYSDSDPSIITGSGYVKFNYYCQQNDTINY